MGSIFDKHIEEQKMKEEKKGFLSRMAGKVKDKLKDDFERRKAEFRENKTRLIEAKTKAKDAYYMEKENQMVREAREKAKRQHRPKVTRKGLTAFQSGTRSLFGNVRLQSPRNSRYEFVNDSQPRSSKKKGKKKSKYVIIKGKAYRRG